MKSTKAETLSLTQLNFMIIAALVVVVFVLVHVQISDPDLFTSIYLARDTALLVESVQALPYDVTFQYPSSVRDRDILFTTEKSQVIPDTEETEQLFSLQEQELHLFTGMQFTQEQFTVDAALFVLEKKDTELSLRTGFGSSQQQSSSSSRFLEPVQFTLQTTPAVQDFAQTIFQELQSAHESTTGTTFTLSFSQGTSTQVLYSTVDGMRTRLLAQALATELAATTPLADSQLTTPTIRIIFSEDYLDSFADKDDEALAARRLALRLVSEVNSNAR